MNALQDWLARAGKVKFSLYAMLAAFATYSSMYAFRKPFTVATFESLEFWAIDYKILLISSQVIGYTLSKFIGIKFVSELGANSRKKAILWLVAIAGFSLLLFAIIPPPYNIVFMFFNGLPLGMIWGLVFSYLEGRTTTEILGAGLSVSFIFSSGLTKSIGKFVMTLGVSEMWMPILTAMIFSLPLILFLWLLDNLPPPNEEDRLQRTERKPMNGSQRWEFFTHFAPGLVMLTISYVLLTIFREFRDNFAAEIWNAVGYGKSPEIFVVSEIPITLVVLVIMSLIMFIRRNITALIVSHGIILIGMILIGLSTIFFVSGSIDALTWMILVGLGLYLGYVPFNSMFFDRFIASFRRVSNVGFLIYLVDSFGYLGSVGLLFYKNFTNPNLSWIDFFINTAYVVSISGTILITMAVIYVRWKYRREMVTTKPSLNIKIREETT